MAFDPKQIDALALAYAHAAVDAWLREIETQHAADEAHQQERAA